MKEMEEGRHPMSYWNMWEQSYHHLAPTFVQGLVDEEVLDQVEKLEDDAWGPVQQWKVQWDHLLKESDQGSVG